MNIKTIQCEIGTVRYTKPAKGRKWWGILDATKGSVWFGSEYGWTIELNSLSHDIEFGWLSRGEPPRQGSQIVFVRETIESGKDRAQKWGRFEDFEAAAQKLAQKLAAVALEEARQQEAAAREAEARKNLPIYRVVQITLWKGQPTTNAEEVVAEGIIPDLSRSASPLPGPVLDFTYRYRIERRVKENTFTSRGVTPEEMAAVSQALSLPEEKPTPGFSRPTFEQLEDLKAVFSKEPNGKTAHHGQLVFA